MEPTRDDPRRGTADLATSALVPPPPAWTQGELARRALPGVAAWTAAVVAWAFIASLLPRGASMRTLEVSAVASTGVFFLLIAAIVVAARSVARMPVATIAGGAAAGATASVLSTVAGLALPTDLAKVVFAVFAGAAVARATRELRWLVPVLVAMIVGDAWSVFSASGPTHRVVAERPPVFEWLTVAMPVAGNPYYAGFRIGIVDVVMLTALVLVAYLWGLGVRRNAAVLAASFPITIALGLWVLDHDAMPALPMMALCFLALNGRALWHDLRRPR